jgi:hypothetical protein
MEEENKFNVTDYEIDEVYEKELTDNRKVFEERFQKRYDVLESNIWTIKHIKRPQ